MKDKFSIKKILMKFMNLEKNIKNQILQENIMNQILKLIIIVKKMKKVL